MQNSTIRKILYTPPRGIGDLIFSLPLLHSLRQAYPEAAIYVSIPKDKKNIVDLIGFLETTLDYLPKPYDDPLAAQRWDASAREDTEEKYRLEKLIYEKYLLGEEYDLAIIPKNFHINTILCNAQISEEDLRKKGIETKDIHMVDRFLKFADYLGIEKHLSFELKIPEGDVTLNSGWKFTSSKPYVVLNLGASLGKKTWTNKGYKEVASWSLDNGFNVILIGDNVCFDNALEIQDGNSEILNTVLKTGYSFDLKNYALLASKSAGVIGPDSGLLHLADAAGAKVIGLYGATSPKKYAPYHNQKNVVSRYNIDGNVKNISPDEVIGKLEKVLK